MFGLSWGEMVVAGLVAFLVLGPDKLPEAARTAGRWYGRFSRFLAETRAVLKTELDLAALERERAGAPPLEKARPAAETTADVPAEAPPRP